MIIRNGMAGMALALSLCACGGGGGESASPIIVAPPVVANYHLSGQLQENQFAMGASVIANELDANLNPTGKDYSTQTSDDLGNFSISGSIGTKLVEIVGDGFFMDELTGNLAGPRIRLRAVADLSINATPTINVLTSLQASRLKQLMMQGNSYSVANVQSQNEVLAAFGIASSTVAGLTALNAMKINGTGDASAVLLATSVTLSKMAANAAVTNSSSVSAELSNFINTMASQLAAPNVGAPSTIYQVKVAAVSQLDLVAIRRNVETYYAKRGVTMTAPKFEEWIDKSSAGTLPQRQIPIPGLSFKPVNLAEAGQLVTSNTITMAGLGNGVSVPVAVSDGTTIIKNNVAQSSLYAQVQNGDTLALRVLTAGYGYIATSTVSIGATSTAWTVGSAPLHGTITGLAGNGLTLQVNGGDDITVVPSAKEFFFTSAIPNIRFYSVTIHTQPAAPGQVCSVTGGVGITGSSAANIVINCHAETPPVLAIPAWVQALKERNIRTAKLNIVGFGSSVGAGASLQNLAQAPVGYFSARLSALFPAPQVIVQNENRSVNGSILSQFIKDNSVGNWDGYLNSGTKPDAVVLAYGMNDGMPAIYNAAQPPWFFYSQLVTAIRRIQNSGADAIVMTTPHPKSTVSWAMPADTNQTYPTFVMAPVMPKEITPAADFSVVMQDPLANGMLVPVSQRHFHVNQLMRDAATETGATLIDVERYWFQAVRTYGEAALFDTGDFVHPNLLGHQLSYQKAIDDYLKKIAAIAN